MNAPLAAPPRGERSSSKARRMSSGSSGYKRRSLGDAVAKQREVEGVFEVGARPRSAVSTSARTRSYVLLTC